MKMSMSVNEPDQIDLNGTRLMPAIEEMFKDYLAQVVRHSRQGTTEIKASTITFTLTVKPEHNRKEYGIGLVGAVKLAPRKPFTARIVGGVEGDVVVVAPDQPELFDE